MRSCRFSCATLPVSNVQCFFMFCYYRLGLSLEVLMTQRRIKWMRRRRDREREIVLCPRKAQSQGTTKGRLPFAAQCVPEVAAPHSHLVMCNNKFKNAAAAAAKAALKAAAPHVMHLIMSIDFASLQVANEQIS